MTTAEGVDQLMDERRFRIALETIEETIRDYKEETIFAALGVIAERFGWELAKKDPGPCCCAYGDFYEQRGIMSPIHACPSDAPLEEDDVVESWLERESDRDLAYRAFSIPRRWS